MRRRFLDRLYIFARGGFGGNGLPKHCGVGGKGGDVIAVAKENFTMYKVKSANTSQRYIAENGSHSSLFCVSGSPGKDLSIQVPPGVQISTSDGQLLGECNTSSDRVVIARGGPGGNSLSNYIGKKGESLNVYLTYKLIADVGLVGFPNAGKSTLLRTVSKAKPKVANYPFTTMAPTVGQMVYKDGRRISMADLPGLIEGASRNVGLGYGFLRHVERTKMLLFVVDIGGFRLHVDSVYRTAAQTVIILNKEIELYKPELLDKPCMLLLNKSDTSESAECERLTSELNSREGLREAAASLPESMQPTRLIDFHSVLSVSAKYQASTVEVAQQHIRTCIDEHCDHMPQEVDVAQTKLLLDRSNYVPLVGRVVRMNERKYSRRE